MQEIDPTFDEKNVGIGKFSRFCQEAASKGLLTVRRLDNGQLEVDTPDSAEPAPAVAAPEPTRAAERGRGGAEGRGRSGRGRGGRGRQEREAPPREIPAEPGTTAVSETAGRGNGGPGASGERLTRDEAFDLLRRAVASLTHTDHPVRASAVRNRVKELLGRDSESLSERNFIRILKDAHDADVVDLRRRGEDFEVARAETPPPPGEQLTAHDRAARPAPEQTGGGQQPRVSLRGRVAGPRGRVGAAPPPELLSLGVVGPSVTPQAEEPAVAPSPAKRGRKRGRAASATESAETPRAAKRPRRARAKKAAKSE
jgi:hypothetical protein